MGVELCSPDVGQPSAAVRNRPQVSTRGRYGRAYGKFCKRVTFGCFQRRIASFCVAGVAICDISTCLMTCQKSFSVAGAILLLRFQKMRCIFRGIRNILETSHVILLGRRSTLDVSCCCFLANRIVSAARSGDNVQIPWHARQFVTSI